MPLPNPWKELHREFEPVYVWEDGSVIDMCRAVAYHKPTGGAVVIVQFLGKLLTSRNGLDYMSWAINDRALAHIKNAANPNVFAMLQTRPRENWESLAEDGRLFNKKEFITLIEEYGRPFPGGNYRTLGEADLNRHRENPTANPQREVWR